MTAGPVEEPLPLDTWAALLGEWYDRRAERIDISPGMLADLRRDLQRAQMRVDELAGLDRARDEHAAAERAIADQRAAAVTR